MPSRKFNSQKNEEMMAFVALLKTEPILLVKSQAPIIRNQKCEAMIRFIIAYDKLVDKLLSPVQVMKKINNMKTAIKIKERNARHDAVVLKPWEDELLKLLEIPGFPQRCRRAPETVRLSVKERIEFQPKPSEIKTAIDRHEITETKKISTEYMHRLIILEQLSYIRQTLALRAI